MRFGGHDIGGMVAFSYARLHPEEVLRLALVELAVPGFGLDEAMDVVHGGLWHFGLFMTPGFPDSRPAVRLNPSVEPVLKILAKKGDPICRTERMEGVQRSMTGSTSRFGCAPP